jgi:hypothetical protein
MFSASRIGRRALPTAVLIAAAFAAPALAVPAAVTLRVEGPSKTTFEGSVTTDGHNVTTASGGTHHCDGTNNAKPGPPGPTAIATLDDGARLGGFTWDGTFSTSFDDYFVTRVASDPQTSSQFWGVFVDGTLSSTGGCQQRVRQGDQVVWAFDAFSKTHALRLSGPDSAKTGQPVTVKVTDSSNGAPLAGASVNGATTRADGNASFSIAQPGVYRVKAERADSVRSNVLVMCVDPQNAEPCTSSDKAAPSLRLQSRSGYLFQSSASRTFYLYWQAQDGGTGSGVATYDVDVRGLSSTPTKADSDWRPLAKRLREPRLRFRGGAGKGYEFRVSAVDRAGNRSGFATSRVLVPIDERDHKLMRLSRGWKHVALKGSWGGKVARTTRRGRTISVRFSGIGAAVIGRRIRDGGRVRVTLDGKSVVRRLRGRDSHSRILVRTRRVRPGRHVLKLRTLGGGPVAVDAIGIEP